MTMNWRTITQLDTASKLFVMETVPPAEKERTILFDLIKSGPLIVSAKALGLLTKDELLEVMSSLKRKTALRPCLVRACAILGEDAEPLLEGFLDDESEYVRKAALEVVARLRLAGLEGRVRRMTGQERIARYAVMALKSMGAEVGQYRDHPDVLVRELFD
ncbi:MAG TPA: hypothetical protein PLB81_09595 [Deltaproteobacteria bacterium]|nr:hypothetical protein [Deltaproteobacteria bacterium]